ncbi:Colicin I receptor precursor [compost metagenome]
MKLKVYLIILFICFCAPAFAQKIIKGKVYDATTLEPLSGVSVYITGTTKGANTNAQGAFAFSADNDNSITVSLLGYETKLVTANDKSLSIALKQSTANMQEVIVTASREVQLRRDAPVAVSKIGAKVIEETQPTVINELINKVPGVVMTNLNNEQHSMSIRQPLTTNPYFLYMEDGIPIRPLGVFNHNALLEMNVTSINSVEVVKGPSSSLYGSEAIGGAINFITLKPSAIPSAKVSVQGDNYGYLRGQFSAGGYVNEKLGVIASGFIARQRDSWLTYSDYDKGSINLRTDYKLSNRSNLIFSATYDKYYSEMTGSVDSSGFYNKKYKSNNSFTYRDVMALRARVTHEFTINPSTALHTSVYYRNNSIGQLPSYAIKNSKNASISYGQMNENSFRSLGVISQGSKRFKFLTSKLITGVSVDYSPNDYIANFVEIQRDPSTGNYPGFTNRPDSLLTDYNARISNVGTYLQYEFSPLNHLIIVVGGRYDYINYNFNNHLPSTAYTGAADSKNSFNKFTPKFGATYNFTSGVGGYVNFSQGFVPPSVNQLYSGVKVPTLQPAVFNNYEVGGWITLLNDKLYADVSLYKMCGKNEIVNYRFPDNSTEYQNSGETLHQGVEYSINYTPVHQWTLRFGGTNAIHKYEEYKINSKEDFSGKYMPQAPKFVANAEVTYRPEFVKGFRISAEWQRISTYFLDNANTQQYSDETLFGFKGVSALNLRAGYNFKGIEIFCNAFNITNELYAHTASLGAYGKNYTPAAPRNFVMGLSYQFSRK